jgi:hypothetical protein
LIQTINDAGSSVTNRISLDHSTGDISFYEDTGTTPKFFWDASAESLGIGTSSPQKLLDITDSSSGESIPVVISNKDVTAGTGQKVTLGFGLARNSGAFKPEAGTIEVGRELDWTSADTNIDSYMAFSTYLNNSATEKLRIDSSGKVGIGTASPAAILDVDGNAIGFPTASSDPAGPSAGWTYYNTTDDTLKTYNGTTWDSLANAIPFNATGGTITTSGSYKIHTFTSSGTFTPNGAGTVEYLVIAGGGGGNGSDIDSGGGGAGGYRTSVSGQTSGGGGSTETVLTVTAQAYTITVGAGAAQSTGNGRGYNGSASSIASLVTTVGGGGCGDGANSGYSGGSGGGGGGDGGATHYAGGSGTANQGYAGGYGCDDGGGGGGAGAAGGNSQCPGNSGVGGAGQYNNITGSSTARAGGGGGAGEQPQAGGVGGGGTGVASGTGGSGAANKGAGGGGAQQGCTGGSGGSGVVIIRYTV